ncbi:Detected protein of confused Function [Hibiscus syriacus]|uniref:Detected protein of confused Function n=1 Tax=Hibiscus syriacus TaxID=106335 RepID=A0A6A2Y009_HIBSY|nr:Detected protein of confused Function [Hibiscus syriacus]
MAPSPTDGSLPSTIDEAFTENNLQDVLRDINTNVFNEIQTWVHQSFNTIRSLGTPDFPEATQSFPVITDANSKSLFTGLVLTKNMEFVDDLLTFEELGKHLKYQGCHVANLSSLDFTAKNGVGVDISILASWYREENYNNPVVVIIDDIELCCGSVLSDFILMLSEWVIKIPVILIMGVATTLDAPRNMLSSNALRCLCPFEFTVGTPSERMDAIVEAVLVKPCSGFNIGHTVAVFMRNYFLSQDGTLTSFIRALKIACTQHFYMEPLSAILHNFVLEEDNSVLEIGRYGLSPVVMWKHVFDLPSCQRVRVNKQISASLANAFSELKRLQNQWRAVVLRNAAKRREFRVKVSTFFSTTAEKILNSSPIVDRFSTPPALSCSLCRLESAGVDLGLRRRRRVRRWSSQRFDRVEIELSAVQKFEPIFVQEILRIVRQLDTALLDQLLGELLKIWDNLTVTFVEINDKVKELLSLLKVDDGKSSKKDLTVTPK